MKRHVLYIGYRIDEPRREAVTINASLYRDASQEAGFRCDFLAYRGSLISIWRLLAYLREVASRVKQDPGLIVHDFFVLTGFSLVCVIYLRLRRLRVRYVKTFINLPGGVNYTSIIGWLRLFLNNRVIYRLLAWLADTVTYIEPMDYSRFVRLPVPLRYAPGTVSPHQGPLRVAYLGHPIRLKGVHLLPHIVSAVQGARPKRITFHFSFSDHWKFPRSLDPFDHDPFCTVEGEMDPDILFGEADVYLLPIRDGFAASGSFNTIWEAMSCGCCVVTVRANHLPSLLTDDTAELVTSPTAQQYARAIIRLIDEPQRLATKQGNALAAYRQHYDNCRGELNKVLGQLYEQV